MKIELDKIAHALASYAAVLTFVLVMPVLCALALTVAAGALKEWYDYTHPANHTADWNDFWADCAGAFLAVLVLAVLA